MKKARNLLTHPKAKSAAVAMALVLTFGVMGMMTSCDKKCYDPKDPKCENYVPPVIDDTIPDNPVDTTPDNPVEPCYDPTNPDCENYDSCYQAKQDYQLASENYINSRRTCLQGYLPRCFDEIPYFKDAYDYHLPRDDSLLSVKTTISYYESEFPEYLIGHEELADSAKTTATRSINQQTIMDSIYNANQGCLR